jgi:hypothetical protein
MKPIQDAAKTAWFWIGLIVAVCGLSFGIVNKAGYAKAEEMRALKSSVDAEKEWRVWLVEQLSYVSRSVGAPVLPPPPLEPRESK